MKSKLTKREILSLFLFLTLIAIILMDMGLIIPNVVLIAADLDVGIDDVGNMVGVYTFLAGGSTLFFGILTDLYKRKNLVVFAGILWSFSALMHPFVTAFWQLFALRMLSALALGVETPAAFSYLADIIPSTSRSKAFAFWGLITTLGGLIAGGIALSFNEIPYSLIDQEVEGVSANLAYIVETWPDMLDTWRLPFLTLGIISILFTILNLLLTKEPKRGASEQVFDEISEENLQYSYKIEKDNLKYIFQRKSNFFLVFNFFDVIVTGILLAYIFPFINVEMGIDFADPDGLLRIVVLLALVAPMAFIVGQFGVAHWADKQVQGGNITARVKVATVCAIGNVPFLALALAMTPNLRNNTYFFGTVQVGEAGSWALWVVFAIVLSIGLAFSFGIAPNWFSSLVDINYPEHRGTMLAMASFVNSIGRGLGAIVGGYMITLFDSIGATLVWSAIIFGGASLFLWVPLFFTAEGDFAEVTREMERRAQEIKEQVESQPPSVPEKLQIEPDLFESEAEEKESSTEE